jgi:hypothetical protein
VATRLLAALLADGEVCLAFCACPALVFKRDCSYISIHCSLEIAEISKIYQQFFCKLLIPKDRPERFSDTN